MNGVGTVSPTVSPTIRQQFIKLLWSCSCCSWWHHWRSLVAVVRRLLCLKTKYQRCGVLNASELLVWQIYFKVKLPKTRRWPLKTANSCRPLDHLIYVFCILWPLTFWPNIKLVARTRDVASLVIVVSAVLVLSCGQIDTVTHTQMRMNALLPRLSSAS